MQTCHVCRKARWPALNFWVVGQASLLFTVRVCSKSTSSPGVNDWRRLRRVARFVKGCPDTGIMFTCPTARGRLSVQNDSDWARDKSTRQSVSAGNIRYGQHLLRTESKDQTVVAMSSGEADLCVATQQAMESMARELGECLDAMIRPVESSAGKDWGN